MLYFVMVKLLNNKTGGDSFNVLEMFFMCGFVLCICYCFEEECVVDYDEFIVVEKKGVESKKGMYNKNREAFVYRTNDFSINAYKAKMFLLFL